MDMINQSLFAVSNGLLIPTIVLLLLFAAQALVLIGMSYGVYASRLAFIKSIKPALRDLTADNVDEVLDVNKLRKTGLVNIYLAQLLAVRNQPVKADKVLSDFEMACEKELGMVKMLAKVGPILGLMGTLIPLGPALTGLASGDMQTLATNMQVAFATTVVGLVIGAIGFFLTQIKSRWYAEDLSDLDYIYATISSASSTKSGA